MITSILMLWIIGPKYLMMPLKTSQNKDIDLQQLPMVSETTVPTTSTVVIILLNGKMLVQKIEFKIRAIIYYYILVWEHLPYTPLVTHYQYHDYLLGSHDGGCWLHTPHYSWANSP